MKHKRMPVVPVGDVDFGWNIVCQCPGSTAEHVFSNRTGTDPANRRRQRKIYDEK